MCTIPVPLLHLPEKEIRTIDIKKGLKRFENFLRRGAERAQWEATANEEDVEFLRCQEQMQEQLLAQHTEVERVIGEAVCAAAGTAH